MENLKHIRDIPQECLKYIYESAQARLGYDAEREEEYRERLQKLPVYTNEEDAVKAFFDVWNKRKGNLWILAKVGVDEEYFYVQEDYFLVTDDGLMLQAADYLGLIGVTPK